MVITLSNEDMEELQNGGMVKALVFGYVIGIQKVKEIPEINENEDEPVTPNEWRKKYGLKPIESPKTVSIKDLVEVTRCKDCKYYVSEEDMKNNEMYKDYNNILGYDGLCMSTDKWTDQNDFCSSGKEK